MERADGAGYQSVDVVGLKWEDESWGTQIYA